MSYKPPYKITPKIIDLVSKISEAVGSFYAQEELRLHRINRIKTIQGSLAIEGNTLTTDQITAILDGKPVIAPINEVQEIRNAIKAYELLDELNPNSLEDLLKAHLTMEAGLIDDSGHFRSGGVGVASGEEIIHYAPPAERVPQLMKELFEWLNNTEEHPLIKSCIFHYEFEFIHPFSDGNGRTGRLWQTLILANWRPVFKNLPIENIVYKYRKEYYRAIAISGGEDGCTPFIEFILGVIDETLALENNAPRSTRDKIIEQIHNNPKITRNELASILGITSDGVKYHLQKMTAKGVIVRHGSARSGYWEVVKG
ncbi:Fic family protein [Porphyromonadaceae bacterium NLAE-zl-C104]|jgi:Fic family protein|uniref:Fic family protein n=1 Tax=Proteiniphilum saccharofermentans TaxID=1642647 RepID=UPI0008F0201F|nr:Fic family protein [Proteiniphilum saccharofermentans]SFT08869.1 Fic family protein [Porphyromonadaceae bacterium NLAE-zl-C104]